MPVRRLLSLSALVGVCLLSVCAVACQPGSTAEPQLLIDDGVAPDLEQLANDVWQQFVRTFAARTDCFGDVSLQTSRSISERAQYDPATATVTVKVPATPGVLEGALVHEWAHHVEHQCDAHLEMRTAFLAAQGLSPSSKWDVGEEWVNIPSEQYAEAAILLVLGERSVPTAIRVSPEAVQILADWAGEKQ